MNERFCSMLGLCARAGKCLYGETACLSGVRSRKVALMLVHSSASDNTRKRFDDACTYKAVPLIVTDEAIDESVGKPGLKLVAVKDKGFARELAQSYGDRPINGRGRNE